MSLSHFIAQTFTPDQAAPHARNHDMLTLHGAPGCALRRAVYMGVAALMMSSISLPTWAAGTAVSKPAVATAPETAKPPVVNSSLDGPLFYQMLVAEVQANAGDAGSAYQIYLEAARRHQIGQLYQRAVEIALRGRAGEQALAAAKAWRQAMPQSKEASEFTAQILMALGRTADLATPLRTLIQLTPTPQQPLVISALPRNLSRLADKKAAAQVLDDATLPWRQPPLELAEAWAASAEGPMTAPSPWPQCKRRWHFDQPTRALGWSPSI
jgi:hypothetical protein